MRCLMIVKHDGFFQTESELLRIMSYGLWEHGTDIYMMERVMKLRQIVQRIYDVMTANI